MENLEITVMSARVVEGYARAIVRADSPPEPQIHLQLEFPIVGPTDIWAAARDEALKFLDPR